jgi:hypothetical protein
MDSNEPRPIVSDASTPEGIRKMLLAMNRPLTAADIRALVDAQAVSEREKPALLEAAESARRDPERKVIAYGRLMRGDEAAIEEVMERLRASERERLAAIEELKQLGAVRSKGLVADLGERLAAAYYGVQLAPPSTPGYDLATADGRKVQVKTLRSTPGNPRTSMGILKPPFDVLLAIRLDFDYRVERAIEVPKPVIERHYAAGTRTSWTRELEQDPDTRRIAAHELVRNDGA